VTPPLVPAKLPNRQPGSDVIDNHAIQRGLHGLVVAPPIPHPDAAGSVLKTEGHERDNVTAGLIDTGDTPNGFSSICRSDK